MLGPAPAEALDAAALLATVVWAVTRPRGASEAVVALPAAAVVVAAGGVRAGHALAELLRLGPVVGFLSAVLVLARLCDDEGLFTAAGSAMARRASGPRGLLGSVFVLASITTAVLSLDTTVVLLTPVVFLTATRLGVRPRPHVYASGHLANTASLLLPVSNLTNLLAYGMGEVSFARFTALMALPWVAAIVAEFVVFRAVFAADLRSGVDRLRAEPPVRIPRFALLVVVATLGGFVLSGLLGTQPVWAALAGAALLAARALARRRTGARHLLSAAAIPFSVFVLCLAVIVRGLEDNGLAGALHHVLPLGSSLAALVGAAAIAAVLANLVNNLPAVLVLLPIAAAGGVAPVLAVLIGVNIGPNLTYVGSLATLLWRRVLKERGVSVGLAEFTRLGALTVPLSGLAALACLWFSLHYISP